MVKLKKMVVGRKVPEDPKPVTQHKSCLYPEQITLKTALIQQLISDRSSNNTN